MEENVFLIWNEITLICMIISVVANLVKTNERYKLQQMGIDKDVPFLFFVTIIPIAFILFNSGLIVAIISYVVVWISSMIYVWFLTS